MRTITFYALSVPGKPGVLVTNASYSPELDCWRTAVAATPIGGLEAQAVVERP